LAWLGLACVAWLGFWPEAKPCTSLPVPTGNNGVNTPRIILILSPTSGAETFILSILFLHKLAQHANFTLDRLMLYKYSFEHGYFMGP
jgi:hypothetical protein